MQTQKVKIDLIVIGNPNSGKTSMIRRFIDGQSSFSHFYNPTLGLSLQKKVIHLGNRQVTVCIWDTAGQQKFFSLTKNYFKRADGVLVIYDLTDRMSFERIQKFWMPEIKDKSDENCLQIMIGNKIDLENQRQVAYSIAKEIADRLNVRYFQTSAKTGENVEAAIHYIVQECLGKVKEDEKRGVQISAKNNKPSLQNRCSAFLDGILSKFR